MYPCRLAVVVVGHERPIFPSWRASAVAAGHHLPWRTLLPTSYLRVTPHHEPTDPTVGPTSASFPETRRNGRDMSDVRRIARTAKKTSRSIKLLRGSPRVAVSGTLIRGEPCPSMPAHADA